MEEWLLANDATSPPKTFELLPKIINGGIAGMIGEIAIFPMDLVKTRLQNQRIGPNGEKQYKSIIDCFAKMYRAEGFFGLYRGLGVMVVMVSPEKAIKLASNDLFRHHFTDPDGKLSLGRQIICGGMAGLCQMSVTCPMELLKIQLQMSATEKKGYRDLKLTGRKLAYNIFKEHGIFGLYRGATPNAYRDITFSSIFFPLFAKLRTLGPRQHDSTEAAFWVNFFSGLVSAGVSAFAVTPFDVVKTRIQRMSKSEDVPVYKGIWDCFYKIFTHEGLMAFFKGGFCRVLVIGPLYGIAQTVYRLGIGEYLIACFRNDRSGSTETD